MSLTNDERATLVTLELKKAHETFEEIGILTAANKWSGAANRLYYAVFHAINALLINDGHAVNTHKGSHAMFNLHYIKAGILPALNMVSFIINYKRCVKKVIIIAYMM